MQMVSKTDNAIIKVSNNIVIHGSQRRCFFIRLKSSDQKKGNHVVVLSFSQHSPRHEAQSENPCDHAYNSVSTN